MSTRKLFFAIVFAIASGLISGNAFTLSCDAQEVTRKEKSAIRTIQSNIDRAARLFKTEKFELAGKSIDKATRSFGELASDASPELIELLGPEREKLAQAFEMLSEQGVDVQAIPPLGVPMAAGGENGNGGNISGAVSFQNEVAPIIVAKCGRCHVQGRRGQFSAATFASLMDSGHVDPRKPNVSRLIEVIENGDMPPGGSLLDEELQTLKNWIAEGAINDAGENANLATLSRNAQAAPEPAEKEEIEVKKPTGKETVSFASDVAPVLIENCSGCHVDVARNARGGLEMTNFRQLLAGGDSGPIVQSGASAKSLLIKKLRGMGDGAQMPQGRPALDERVIQMIGTWIDEGARFDGQRATERVRIVAAKASANSMSHDELAAQRKELATQNWRTVMSDIGANTADVDDLLIISSYDSDRVAEIGEVAQSVVPLIRSTMNIKGGEPLVKGKISLFVFERRYDFNEFGVMIDRREIPKQIKSRWGYDVVDANVAVLMTRNETPESLQATLARQMGATYVSSLAPQTPRWFVDGMGYWIASKSVPRAEGVSEWDDQAETLIGQMAKPDDFIRGQLPDDQTALVSFYFISELRKKNSGKFSRLLAALENGEPFDAAFTSVYRTTPSKYVGN